MYLQIYVAFILSFFSFSREWKTDRIMWHVPGLLWTYLIIAFSLMWCIHICPRKIFMWSVKDHKMLEQVHRIYEVPQCILQQPMILVAKLQYLVTFLMTWIFLQIKLQISSSQLVSVHLNTNNYWNKYGILCILTFL